MIYLKLLLKLQMDGNIKTIAVFECQFESQFGRVKFK